MAESLTRHSPLAGEPAVHAGGTIALAPAMQRWSLRARTPAALEAVLGVPLPHAIGETLGDIACLGPDEWLLRATDPRAPVAAAGQALSIVDISERSIGFLLEGPAARAVLNSGCPLDLERFAIGRTTRTIYEGTEIILFRAAEQRWTVDVWRSYAEWFWLHTNFAASEPRSGGQT